MKVSLGAGRVLDNISIQARKTAPVTKESPKSFRCPEPNNSLTIWGTINPINPISPLAEIIIPIKTEMTRIIALFIRLVSRPRVVAVSSPSEIKSK